MKSIFCRPSLALGLALMVEHFSIASPHGRTELAYPDLPDFKTIRCDFCLDSVTPERVLWPSLAVHTAWRNGVDAVAVVDNPGTDANHACQAYQEAVPVAEDLKLLLISALALNGPDSQKAIALFTTNASSLCGESHTTMSNVMAQGAFVFLRKGNDGKGRREWARLDSSIAMPTGVEIVSEDGYDAEAHRWALDRNVTLIGNGPVFDPRNTMSGGAGPMTLVFAKERSLAGIKDALLNRRTAVVCDGRIYGAAEYLEPLFQSSIQVISKNMKIRGKGRISIQILNSSPLAFELRLNSRLPELDVPDRLLLPSGKVVILEGACVSARVTGEIQLALPCRVLNLLFEPGRPLRTALRLKINYAQGN